MNNLKLGIIISFIFFIITYICTFNNPLSLSNSIGNISMILFISISIFYLYSLIIKEEFKPKTRNRWKIMSILSLTSIIPSIYLCILFRHNILLGTIFPLIFFCLINCFIKISIDEIFDKIDDFIERQRQIGINNKCKEDDLLSNL